MVGFGRARVCLSFASFYAFSPLFLSLSSRPLSSHPLKVCPKQRVCYEKCLYTSYFSHVLEHVLSRLTAIVTLVYSSDPSSPFALALHPRLC